MGSSGCVSVLLMVVLALAGCGGDEARTPEGPPAKANGEEPAKGEPAKRVWAVQMTFSIPVGEAARTVDDALAEVILVVDARLKSSACGEYGIRRLPADGPGFEVGFASLPAERFDEIVSLITRAGTLEFLIVVRAPKQFAKAPGNEEPVSPRHPLWEGDNASHRAFLDGEIQSWTAARKADKPYRPSRAGYRIVPTSKASKEEPLFVLVEVPKPDEVFDGRMLENPVVSADVRNMPVVVFDIKEEWQERFGAWTEKNRLLPLAIVLDGVQHSAPIIQAKLTRNVQITLGPGSRADQERDAEALVTVLQTGAMASPPKLVSIKTN